MELSKEQEHFVELALQNKNILVDACIGSGKTTSIQELCNRFDENKKILYLTYNKLLKIDAINKIKNKNVKVQNYHGFVYGLLASKKIKVSVPELLNRFLLTNISTGNYDVLIIDEYQDIDTQISQVLLRIKQDNPSIQIIAVGDMNQKIYDFTSLNVFDFINDFLDDYEKMSFTQCFRLQNEYAKQIGDTWHKEILGVNNDMIVKQCDNYLDFLMDIAVHNPSEILCLGNRTGQMSEMLNLLEERFPYKFNKNTVFASIKEGDSGVSPKEDSAIFTTFDGSKGLERPYCYVFDFSLDNWFSRISKPNTKSNILKNIFLVAASRGKKEIIFVNFKKNDKKFIPLDLDYLKKIDANNDECSLNFSKPFQISNMYNFKYKEDIDRCFGLLDIKKISLNDTTPMNFKEQDGLIDLSPVIGIWQQAIFFKNYNVWQIIENERYENQDKFISCRYDDTVQKQVLALVAYDTNQNRYYTQVKEPFLTKTQENQIKKRLGSYFTGNEVVEKGVWMSYMSNYGEIKIHGRIDVIDKDNRIVELKYVSQLAPEHYLQLATYLVATKQKTGILWNTKNNEMYEVSVIDPDRFIVYMTETISKGKLTRVMNVNYTNDLYVSEMKKRYIYQSEQIRKRTEAKRLKKAKEKGKQRAKKKAKKITEKRC